MKHHCPGLTGWYSGDGCPQPVVNLQPGELFTDGQAMLIAQGIIIFATVMVFLAITFVAWSMANND